MQFTGDYYQCKKCDYIYDYNDNCPNCGSQIIEDINPIEVLEASELFSNDEKERINKMLDHHGHLA